MRILALLYLLATAVAAQKIAVPLDESDKEGVLDILILNSWGDPGPDQVDLTIEKLVDGKKAGELPGQRTMKLKYGTYRLLARAGGMYPVERTVSIRHAYQAVIVCFFLAPIESPWEGNLVRGHISQRSKESDCRWIRLASLFADDVSAETKASAAGDFGTENVRPGKYLALAIGKHGVCETAEVTILFEQHVTDLDLSWVPADGK